MSNQATDNDYLRKEQYRQSDNLDARAELHRRFSVNQQGLHRWIFEQMDLPDECRVLEVGCGPGWLWQENGEYIPTGWRIHLTDLSFGMVETTKGSFPIEEASVADVQSLPFPDGHFDSIVANHMLYHVPDKAQALAEFRRVLKAGGRVYAATNGKQHMHELYSLSADFDESLDAHPWILDFTLENGADILKLYFAHLELRRYEDALEVTEAEPLAAYIASMVELEETQYTQLLRFIQKELEKYGNIHISKDVGIFVAQR